MNADNFEKQLQRQPVREIPREWREEILSAAAAPVSHLKRESPEAARRSTFHQVFSAIFWPHPKAWAGLAAVWLLIFSAHLATQERAGGIARKPEPPSPQMIIALQQQKRLLHELIGASTPPPVEPPKPPGTQPQSYRREDWLFV